MNNVTEQRITFNPRQCGGQPCIRGLRIRVTDILETLAQGVSQEEILADFPNLELADIYASRSFAARNRAHQAASGRMRDNASPWARSTSSVS